jgi:hypothetical protein
MSMTNEHESIAKTSGYRFGAIPKTADVAAGTTSSKKIPDLSPFYREISIGAELFAVFAVLIRRLLTWQDLGFSNQLNLQRI